MTFPLLDSPLLTDHTYRQLRRNHSIGISPFLQLPMDMISCFPIDYMHCVCLGVTKRLLGLWLSSPIQRNLRIGSNAARLINEGIRSLHPSLCSDFQRRCRTFDDVDRWKATEFRQFLLYLGPVLLKHTIDPCKYNNFLEFFIPIYILCHPILHSVYNDFASSILRIFVHNFGNIYGHGELVYNVHNLIHLPQDVKNHGPLDNFSAFPFENHIRHLKTYVHGSTRPAQQIFR